MTAPNPDGEHLSLIKRDMSCITGHEIADQRAVQLLLGHTKIDSTVHYFSAELEDALEIAEASEIWC